ncbi:unnamed protein product [Phytomonas sp. Hart1]|nr:unnamed protein product [Phytomonas sp. Hart1]|eukprot:CCW68864.1 unnamed protein product [Phytomonas sp. isolate Hart1]
METSQLPSPSSISDGVILYCLVGVHPNNICSMNLKLQEKWIGEIRCNAKNSEVVGILSGLDLGRGSDSHYAQEWMLRQSWWLAGELRLPLVLFVDSQTSEGLIFTGQRMTVLLDELIQSSSSTESAGKGVDTPGREPSAGDNTGTVSSCKAPVAVVLHNGMKILACSEDMRNWVSTHQPESPQAVVLRHSAQKGTSPYHPVVPAYVIATAEGLNIGSDGLDKTENATATDCIEYWAKTLPRLRSSTGETSCSHIANTMNEKNSCLSWTQLLVGTSSPWCTPQNLPDKDLGTLPNEPGHYPYVVRTLYEVMKRVYEREVGDTLEQTECNPLASHEALEDLVLCNTLWVFFAGYIAEALLKDDPITRCYNGHSPIDVNKGHLDPSLTKEKTCPDVHFQDVRKVYVCIRCQNLLFDQLNYALKGSPFDDSFFSENKGPQVQAYESGTGNQESHNLPLMLHNFASMSTNQNGSYNLKGSQFSALSVHGRLLCCRHCGAQVGCVKEGEEDDTLSDPAILAHLTEVELVPYNYYHSLNLLKATNSNQNSTEKTEEPIWCSSKAQCVIKKYGDKEKDTDDFQALLEQAALEREEIERDQIKAEEYLYQDTNKTSKKRKEGKKNVKANNRSNFSHFRNKDFVPRSVREKEKEKVICKITDDDYYPKVRNGFSQDIMKYELLIQRDTTTFSSVASSHERPALEKKRSVMPKQYLVEEKMCAGNTMEPSFISPSRRQRKKNKKRQQPQVKTTDNDNDDSVISETFIFAAFDKNHT